MHRDKAGSGISCDAIFIPMSASINVTMRVPHSVTAANTMFTKLFKTDDSPEKSKTATPVAPAAAPQPAPDKAPWEAQLQAAMGDDEALLAVAKTAPFIDIKHAAVQALTSEEALKKAEREFRNHDRRVHREAKQRLEAKIAEREARAAATILIDAASLLVQEKNIPANRLVELDRAWQHLDTTLLEESQRTAYATVWTQLSGLARERGDQQLWTKRWLAEANRALTQFHTVCLQAARGGREDFDEDVELARARAAVEETLSASLMAGDVAAAVPSVAPLQADLRTALQLASDTAARLAFLNNLPATAVGTEAAHWQTLAIADAHVAAALNARFEQWQREQTDARLAHSAEVKKQSSEQKKAARHAQQERILAALTEAETALAGGHVAETIQHLHKVDELTQKTSLDKAVQTRIETAQAEAARLKGWQHWGGGRVREDLVIEAEALAKASAAEKLPIKAHADAIDNLRERWKELDKLGGATNRTLWTKFDGALKTAFLPVAAHLDKLKAVRDENLKARNALVAGLDAVVLADAAKEETQDWRALARTLEHFQTEWRKLGPLEHTVPHKARKGLETRLNAAVARLDAPLGEVRRVEQLKRTKLIERAKVLAADPSARDAIPKVRELQNEWQQAAKGLPLARGEENKLWGEFKAATDAIFKGRDALHAARDAEFKTHQVAREALIARLDALTADTPTPELKRTIADIDRDWRNAGEAPRAVAAKIDANFRTARDRAQQYLAGSANRVWHATCDALAAKLALCEEIEAALANDAEARWQTIAALPQAWERAVHGRFKTTLAGGSSVTSPDIAGKLLLKLEAALNIDSPASSQAARSALKLLALKNAMEGRQSASTSATEVDRMLAEAFQFSRLEATARERLRGVVAALRSGTHRSA